MSTNYAKKKNIYILYTYYIYILYSYIGIVMCMKLKFAKSCL